MPCHLIVMAREPVPGQTKTRLAGELGAEGAAHLQAALALDLCERLAGSFEMTVAVDANPGSAYFQDLAARTGAKLVPQGSGDLGARMARALEACLRAGDPAALLIGTDLPALPEGHLIAAAERLKTHALVLGPAADGGYYAVGASRAALIRWDDVVDRLFSGIAWGGPSVLHDTLVRAREPGAPLDVALAPAWYDVDEARDLLPLVRHLASGAAPELPRTRALLSEWGRL
jgi:rSAM/selenodomain-associated transferase 1